jgi:hypothetical protein
VTGDQARAHDLLGADLIHHLIVLTARFTRVNSSAASMIDDARCSELGQHAAHDLFADPFGLADRPRAVPPDPQAARVSNASYTARRDNPVAPTRSKLRCGPLAYSRAWQTNATGRPSSRNTGRNTGSFPARTTCEWPGPRPRPGSAADTNRPPGRSRSRSGRSTDPPRPAGLATRRRWCDPTRSSPTATAPQKPVPAVRCRPCSCTGVCPGSANAVHQVRGQRYSAGLPSGQFVDDDRRFGVALPWPCESSSTGDGAPRGEKLAAWLTSRRRR